MTVKSYKELITMFGSYYDMPPEEAAADENELEYRCPYMEKCPTAYKCYVAAAPNPLPQRQIINIRCRLMGGKTIPVYTDNPRKVRKK